MSGIAAGAVAVGATQAARAFATENGSSATADADDGSGLETRDTVKLLIIGGGLAGFVAGITALEEGMGADEVLIIDKLSGEGGNWGGSSYLSGGSYLTPVSDSEEDVEAYAQAQYEKGLEHGDMDLLETLAHGSYSGLQWLKDHGAQYSDPTSVFPKNPEVLTSVADMPTLMQTMRDDYEGLGGRILWSTKALKLTCDADGVSGCIAMDADGIFALAAEKTILCTGGYTANREFLEDHVGENGSTLMNRSRSTCTGDGIYMAREVGGCTVGSVGLRSVHLSAVDPVAVAKGQPGNQIPFFIAINSEGKRFVDEALGSVRHGQAVFQQSVQRDGLLTDSKVLDDIQEVLDKLAGQGVQTWKTDTLEEMAEIFGVDADALQATVDEFNAAVQEDGTTKGLSPDKTANAKTIDTPPYYGIYPLVPGTSLTFGGIKVDTSSHVLMADGTVIPNLFAAGEGTGGFFYDDYFGGSCICRCTVFGQIATKTAISEM